MKCIQDASLKSCDPKLMTAWNVNHVDIRLHNTMQQTHVPLVPVSISDTKRREKSSKQKAKSIT